MQPFTIIGGGRVGTALLDMGTGGDVRSRAHVAECQNSTELGTAPKVADSTCVFPTLCTGANCCSAGASRLLHAALASVESLQFRGSSHECAILILTCAGAGEAWPASAGAARPHHRMHAQRCPHRRRGRNAAGPKRGCARLRPATVDALRAASLLPRLQQARVRGGALRLYCQL